MNLIIMDLGVFDRTPEGLKLMEIAPGITLETIAARTGATYRVAI